MVMSAAAVKEAVADRGGSPGVVNVRPSMLSCDPVASCVSFFVGGRQTWTLESPPVDQLSQTGWGLGHNLRCVI